MDDDIRTVASIIGLEVRSSFRLTFLARFALTPIPLDVQSPIASILLQHFRWNRDRLIERFMDDSATVLADAGEPDVAPSSPNPRPSKRVRLDTPTEFMCAICCDTDPANVFRPRCGHEFCEACWATYVTSKIKEEGQCLFNCIQDGCKTAVDEPSIEKLVTSSVLQRCVEAPNVFIYGMCVWVQRGLTSVFARGVRAQRAQFVCGAVSPLTVCAPGTAVRERLRGSRRPLHLSLCDNVASCISCIVATICRHCPCP